MRTDVYNPDMDKDGLTDGAEKLKGTNPLVVDTDGDGIADVTDEELTQKEKSRYVNAQGKFDQALFDNRDDDKDEILDAKEAE